jgi:nucleotide-binding universal stress UspA family protein
MFKHLQSEAIESSRGQFAAEVQRRAEQILGQLAAAAAKAGVPCDTCVVDHEHVYEGIVTVAKTRNCDLIVMASHGRRGVRALLPGSERCLAVSASPISGTLSWHAWGA